MNGIETATRYHDFSAGHRVHGHESKCALLHGHNYRIYFEIGNKFGLDDIGRVLDFSAIKSRLCQWLEEYWDHRFLIWEQDPIRQALTEIDSSVVWVPFNPTAENMAKYLVETVAPAQLEGTSCMLIAAQVWETRKCFATYRKQVGVYHTTGIDLRTVGDL